MSSAIGIEHIIRELLNRFTINVSVLQRNLNDRVFNLFFNVENVLVNDILSEVEMSYVRLYTTLKIESVTFARALVTNISMYTLRQIRSMA